MAEREAHHFLKVRRGGVVWAAAQAAGKVLGAPYAGTMRLRRWAYHRGLMRSASAGVPVISVGNVTMGGTGKTPMVVWVVRQLAAAGASPAILTRGYKGGAGAGDEVEFLRRAAGVDVVVNADRAAGAAEAVARGADVLVMDDGFQHMRLRRDLNVVLIDATAPFGGGCCLPLGRLREPLSALRDADAVVITRSDLVAAGVVASLRERMAKLAPRASRHLAVHRTVGLIDAEGAARSPDALADRKVLAFCGIGNGRAFLATVKGLRAEVVGLCRLGDHVRYTPRLVEKVFRLADRRSAELLVTTEKDYVKLRSLPLARGVWQVVIQMTVTEGRDQLRQKVLAAAGRGE